MELVLEIEKTIRNMSRYLYKSQFNWNYLKQRREKEMNTNKKIGWIGFFLYASLLGAPYTDSGIGTITDSATGLIWQKCSAGLGTTLGNCSTGSISSYTWSSAISYCEGLTLGSRSDWRLPNINELGSIIDYTKSSNPTIDLTAFPNTQSYYYWSSSTNIQGINSAWNVVFDGGKVNSFGKDSSYYVRCVTGP
jgi:hypothetical protein